jgi:hypothetical protein
MARGKKSGPSRMDLRKQAEAAEAKEREDEDEVEEGDEDEEDEEGDEDGEGAEGDTEAEGDADAGGDDDDSGGDDDDDDDAPKKKKAKKKAPAKPKKATTKRVRAPKEVRQKAVWVVFDNSSKEVGTFDYSKKHDAEKFLEKKIQEKEGKATFYMNLVKRELKEEKEK